MGPSFKICCIVPPASPPCGWPPSPDQFSSPVAGVVSGRDVLPVSCDQGCGGFGFVSVAQIMGSWRRPNADGSFSGGHLLLGNLDAAMHWPYLLWAQVCSSTACHELAVSFPVARKPRQTPGRPEFQTPMIFEVVGC